MAKLEITLIRSVATRPYFHRRTVEALGFHRMHETRILPDNPAIRGMIAHVSHMVKWKVIEEGDAR